MSVKSENLIDTIEFANGKISEQLISGLKPFNKDLKRPDIKTQLLNSPEILDLIAEAKQSAENAATAEESLNPLSAASSSSDLRVQKSSMKTKAVDAGKSIINGKISKIVNDFIVALPPPSPLAVSSPPTPISVSSPSVPSPV
jgi:hypothetical protein